MVVATHKEVLELDISKILQPPAFLKDETEYDIEVIRKYATFHFALDKRAVSFHEEPSKLTVFF